MRRIIYFLIFISIFSSASAQKIIENRTDELTKDKIICTSWETISKTDDLYSYFRIRVINDRPILEMKYFTNSSVSEGKNVDFTFEDGQSISLAVKRSATPCIGCGATGLMGSGAAGIHLKLILEDGDVTQFRTKKIKKIAVTEYNSRRESNVPEKQAETFQKLIALALPQLITE